MKKTRNLKKYDRVGAAFMAALEWTSPKQGAGTRPAPTVLNKIGCHLDIRFFDLFS